MKIFEWGRQVHGLRSCRGHRLISRPFCCFSTASALAVFKTNSICSNCQWYHFWLDAGCRSHCWWFENSHNILMYEYWTATISESLDSPYRDDTNTPIVCIEKPSKLSCSKPFSASSHPILIHVHVHSCVYVGVPPFVHTQSWREKQPACLGLCGIHTYYWVDLLQQHVHLKWCHITPENLRSVEAAAASGLAVFRAYWIQQ